MTVDGEALNPLHSLVASRFSEEHWRRLLVHVVSLEDSGLNNKDAYFGRLKGAIKTGNWSQVVDQAAVADTAVRLGQAGVDVVPEPSKKGPDIKVVIDKEEFYVEVKRLRQKDTTGQDQHEYYQNISAIDAQPFGDESPTSAVLDLFSKAQFHLTRPSVLLIADWGRATPAHFYSAAKSIEARAFPHKLSAVIYGLKYVHLARYRVWFNMQADCPLTIPMVKNLAHAFGGEVVLAPEIRITVREHQFRLANGLDDNRAPYADDPRFVYQLYSKVGQERA